MAVFSKKWKFFFGALCLILLFSIAYLIGQNSWDGKIFVAIKNERSSISSRSIASVGKDMNLSLLVSGEQLTKKHQEALVQHSEVKSNPDNIIFYLGQFVVFSKENQLTLVCKKYQSLNMTFIASNESFHGHSPEMILSADCSMRDGKPLQIGPFLIPKKTVLNSHGHQRVFTDDLHGTLLFNHVDISWPRMWILSKVQFIKEGGNEDFVVRFDLNKKDKKSLLVLRF